MQFNNSKSKNLVLSLYFVFAIVFIFASFYFSFFRKLIDNDYLRIIVLLIILVVVFFAVNKMVKYFAYDSDGAILILINRGILLPDYIIYKENRAEFPKRKLLHYKLKNYALYKSLSLYIDSNEKHQKRLKFNVTLVSDKKLKYLKQSLDKVIKQNKEKS